MSLAERFGWTWSELDEADMSQVLPAVAASNIYQAYRRYASWAPAAAQNPNIPFPSDDDGRIWAAVVAAQGQRNA